jgi:hypothetical protein
MNPVASRAGIDQCTAMPIVIQQKGPLPVATFSGTITAEELINRLEK